MTSKRTKQHKASSKKTRATSKSARTTKIQHKRSRISTKINIDEYDSAECCDMMSDIKCDDPTLMHDPSELCPHADSKIANKSNAIPSIPLTFFCTNDTYFNTYDDAEIIQFIQQKYSNFLNVNVPDAFVRKTILQLLADTNYVIGVLDYFNLTLQEFLKLMFRTDAGLFKGIFMKKMQAIALELEKQLH